VAKVYKDDGVSWRDGGTFCFTEEHLQTYPEKRQKYLRKWNCVEPEGTSQTVAIGFSKFVDVFFNEIGTYLDFGDDWGDGRMLMSHIDDDGIYASPANFAQDSKDYWYKVLHAGLSLVFSAPLMAVMSIINRELSSNVLDPGLVNHMSLSFLPDEIVSMFKDRTSTWGTAYNNTWNPVGDHFTLTCHAGSWEPIALSEALMDPYQVVTYDPVSVS
jgi:hypothetical protein